MNTNLGYSKKTLTNTDVLLSGGGNKPLTDFIGSISWDATNRKLQYKSAASNASLTNVANLQFGTAAFESSYTAGSGLRKTSGNLFINTRIPFVKGTQTGTTGSWTGVCDDITELYDGLTIAYWLPYAGSGNASLNLTINGTDTGAIECYYGGTTRLTTHYGANNLVLLTYRLAASGSYITGSISRGWWAHSLYYAVDINAQRLYYSRITAGTNGIKQFSLIMLDANNKWQSFTMTAGTGVTKTKNTSGFKLGSRIYYANTSGNYTNGLLLGYDVIRTYLPTVDLRYSINVTYDYSGASGTVPGLIRYKPVYIVGTINSSDGLFYLDDTWWTLTEPTSEDGKVYIKVVESVYADKDSNDPKLYRGDLVSDGYAFLFKNGVFRRYYPSTALTVNGTAYSLNTSELSLPTLYAIATSNATAANQVWMRNSNNSGYAWRTLGSNAFNSTSYAASSHNHDGRYVQDYGSSITVTLYDIPTKYIFSGSNVIDGPTTGWISGLVLGSNWNNNHYLHYLVESGSRWYATRSYADNKMKDWNQFAYVTDNVASATKLETARTIWGLSFDGTSNVSGNMTDVGSISASGNIAITKTSENAIFRVTNNNGSIDLRVNTNASRGVYDSTTNTWIIATNGTYTALNQGNVGIGTTPTEKLDVDGIILGTSVKAGAFGINNTSKTSGKGISLYNGVTSGAPTNGIMFAGTDTFGTCGGVTYTWSTYFTVSNKTNIGWIFRRGSTNVASIDGNGSGYFSSSLTSSAVYTPSVEFKNVAAGAGNGGYIDFHYNGASSYTSRIIESASGNIEASCTNFITNGTQFNLLTNESIINMRVPSSTSYVRALSYRGTTASNADLYVGNDFHDTRLTGRDVYIIADEVTVMCIKHNSNSVGIGTSSPNYKLEVNGNCGATNFIGTSDVRLKNIISYQVPDLDTIAAAPGFLFKWKDQEKGTKIYAGTSALYWYDKFSYVVHKANDLIGTLAIQHDVLGVLCSISIARELKMLKEEVQEIKEYINNHLQ